MNQTVTANARAAQDQDDYARFFAELENQYQQQTHRIERLETQIEEKDQRAIQIRRIHQYQCEHPSIEYSDDAWNTLIDHATVSPDCEISFTLKDGSTLPAN